MTDIQENALDRGLRAASRSAEQGTSNAVTHLAASADTTADYADTRVFFRALRASRSHNPITEQRGVDTLFKISDGRGILAERAQRVLIELYAAGNMDIRSWFARPVHGL